MSAQTITEFLTARIEEDEAAARAATESGSGDVIPEGNALRRFLNAQSGTATVEDVLYFVWCSALDAKAMMQESHATEEGYLNHQRNSLERARSALALGDPARVLREVAAKRAMVEYFSQTLVEATPLRRQSMSDLEFLRVLDAQRALGWLADSYADHPDYDQRWSTDA